VPAERLLIVVVVPVPVVSVPPGVRVKVQVPLEGRPLISTLAVATLQLGWVIVPAIGADGIAGCASMRISDEDTDVQPEALVTVYV